MENLETFKKVFDKELENYLDEKIRLFLKDSNNHLFKDMLLHTKKIALSGGKRIRPYLAFLMYQISGGRETEKAMKLFLSLEIFHLFALVHDDIMDNGETRHGMPTLHCYIENLLSNKVTPSRRCNLKKTAESQAILIGDLLFSWSQEILATNTSFERDRLEAVKKYYYQMVNDTMLGQMIDIDLTIKPETDEEKILQKMLLKTARYTFVYPMQMGASLAGATDEILRFCKEFGENLGLGFQIQDDLLDIPLMIDHLPLNSGKTAFSDLQAGQHTLLTQYIFDHGTEEQKKLLQTNFGRPVSEKDAQALINLFQTSAAIEYAEKKAEEYFQKARESLNTVQLNNQKKEKLFKLVEFVKKRKT